ncbi:hypothetical protein Hanom_Chr05g00410391 [Helianthus anomalus]
MADKALAAKLNEVESSTVSAESSNQVRSLNEKVENGKSIDEKCRHCINMCKICTEKENGLKSKIDELTQTENALQEANLKIDSLKVELVLKEKLKRGSKDEINLLEENIRKGESEIERFRTMNEMLTFRINIKDENIIINCKTFLRKKKNK